MQFTSLHNQLLSILSSDSSWKEPGTSFPGRPPLSLKLRETLMFTEMLLIHRIQIVFSNRRCMPGFSGFGGIRGSTMGFLLQMMRSQAGSVEEPQGWWNGTHVICPSISKISSGSYLWDGRAQRYLSTLLESNTYSTWEGNIGGWKGPEEIVKPCLTASTKERKQKEMKNIRHRLQNGIFSDQFLSWKTWDVKWLKVAFCAPWSTLSLHTLAKQKGSYRQI